MAFYPRRQFVSLLSIFLFTFFLLTACASASSDAIAPTAASLANAPAVLPQTAPSPIAPETTTGDEPPTPIPAGDGVRPDEARQYFAPDAGPDQENGRRPPPVAVPLALHPDDHYWLSRPIPANKRNYELEWYPFGNDVMVDALYPYRIHHGIDLPNPTGTPVLAAGSGLVIHAGPRPSPRNGVNYYGNTIIIEHDWQWNGRNVYTLYAHTLEMFVQVGDRVEAGELLAGVGASGAVTDSHLHFEVRVGENNYNYAQNPMLWLAPYEGWGVLAGRFEDKQGQLISDAFITLEPINVNAPIRRQRTYHPSIRSDEIWLENFVVGDLPAGRYRLTIDFDNTQYERDIEIRPGQTTYTIVAAEFEFRPTATPLPTPTITATVELPTEEITTTIEIDN